MKEGMIQSEVTAIQPRVLFKPGSWLAKIDFINHLILFNNVLVTVLSEKEGGKTSFGTLLQNNLDQQIKSVSITIEPSFNRENFIKDIITQLHLNHDENTDITSITAHINECKSHVLLLIDDAQYLPEDLIKEALLAIKSQADFGFFHLCLISDYSIVAPLNNLTASFSDNLIHTIELGALSESEIRTYVLQRAMAAHLISKPLSDSQFKQFYQLTKGNVAKINSDLEAFVFKCSSHKKKNSFKALKTAGIAASIALIAGFLGFYLSQSFELFPSSSHEAVTASAQNKKLQTIAIKLPVQPKVLVSYVASWQDSSTRQLVYSSLPKKQALDNLDDIPSDTQAIVDKVVVIPKLKAINLAAVEQKIPTSKPASESKLLKVSLGKQIKKNKFSSAKPISNLHKSNANLYTIQIAASHNKKEIEHFQKNNKLLAQNAKLRHFTNSKGIWYVLTLGEYESRVQAQHSTSRLPSTLVELHPWVRPVSSLG